MFSYVVHIAFVKVQCLSLVIDNIKRLKLTQGCYMNVYESYVPYTSSGFVENNAKTEGV